MTRNLLAATLIGVFLSATPAAAHSSLTSSNIASGAVLETAPEALEIAFGADVGLAEISLKTAAGETVKLDYEKPRSMQKAFVIPLPKTLAPGAYVFTWRTMAKDGHAMKGEIPFTLK